MKTASRAILLAVLFVLCHTLLTAQTNAEQTKMMQAWTGTWTQKTGKDTVEVWKIKQYGNAYTMDIYLEIRGKKVHQRKNNFTYSTDDGKFKGFQIYYNGYSDTWTGKFESEKKFIIEMTRDFVPGSSVYKYEMNMTQQGSFTLTRFENGVKAKDYVFKKEKE